MTEEQNTIALNKARAYSDNKDKIDGFYNGYVQATKELQEVAELKAQIQKMKCCENCQTVRDANGVCYLSNKCKNLSEWKLKVLAE